MAISASFVIGCLLMSIKFYAYWLTQSAAILSDALESIINVVASAFALGAVVLAARPPDSSHPYGHGKIEYFSVGFEGALIFLAAIGIFIKAADQLWHPRELPSLETGLWLLLAVNVVNLALGLGLIFVGKRTHSITLVADGRHILTDVYTTGGVLIGLFLVWLTDKIWLDGATAALVGANILYTGWKLVSHSFAGLMDAVRFPAPGTDCHSPERASKTYLGGYSSTPGPESRGTSLRGFSPDPAPGLQSGAGSPGS